MTAYGLKKLPLPPSVPSLALALPDGRLEPDVNPGVHS